MLSLSKVLSDHISTKWTKPDCPMCSENSWLMNGPFALVPVGVDENGYVMGYRTAEMGSPIIAMVCGNCGHSSLLDYNVVIGLEP